MGRGVGQRGGRVGKVAQPWAHPGALEPGDRVDEALLLGAHGRVPRGVGPGEVRPDAGDLDGPLGLGPGGGLDEVVPVGAERPAPRQARVDLELEARGRPALPGGVDHGFEGPARPCGDVDAGGDGAGNVGTGREDPGQQGCRDPRAAQLERLGELGDPEPGGTAAQRGPGRRNQPVAVAVGLDDGHHLGGTGAAAEFGDVVADRVEVDARPCRGARGRARGSGGSCGRLVGHESLQSRRGTRVGICGAARPELYRVPREAPAHRRTVLG